MFSTNNALFWTGEFFFLNNNTKLTKVVFKDLVMRIQDIQICHVYKTMYNHISLCSCKCHIPNEAVTGLRQITAIL